MPKSRRAALLAPALLLLAGCGGGGMPVPGNRDVTVTSNPQATFVHACGDCHTLARAGTHGTAGPSLDELKPSAQDVVHAIEDGPGTMPSGLLNYRDTAVVARYVASATG